MRTERDKRIEMVADATEKSMPADMSFGEKVEVCIEIIKRVVHSYDAAGKRGDEIREELDDAWEAITDAANEETFREAKAHSVQTDLEEAMWK